MAESSYFRGYHAIKEVVDYVQPLVEWMAQFKPDTKELTLKRGDYDLIKRWPKAAGLFDISVTEEEISYRGVRLKHDLKAPRYEHK